MYLGIDFGTSGCRACIIDDSNTVLFETNQNLLAPKSNGNTINQDPLIWWEGLLKLFRSISLNFTIKHINSLSINGTSATVLHCDSFGTPLSPALMYNDLSSLAYVDLIKKVAPKSHVTLSASSALSKMMLLQHQNMAQNSKMLNQADWLSNRLCGEIGFSDYNNALKMGYDPVNKEWPAWVTQLVSKDMLPKVLEPGSTIGSISPIFCQQFGFNKNVAVKLGTTDSIAAFMATGIKDSKKAVTSLGSTLVLKQLMDKPIEASELGIYSHKLGRYWLAGGASNSGGKVLSLFFNAQQLKQLSTQINPFISSGFNYYPLPSTGERFPINDAKKISKITPRAKEDDVFLKALLEGIANIEHLGYQKLAQLGAHYPQQIVSCGGGANNLTWQSIRQRILGTEVLPAQHSQACYGSALLAKNGITEYL